MIVDGGIQRDVTGFDASDISLRTARWAATITAVVTRDRRDLRRGGVGDGRGAGNVVVSVLGRAATDAAAT